MNANIFVNESNFYILIDNCCKIIHNQTTFLVLVNL